MITPVGLFAAAGAVALTLGAGYTMTQVLVGSTKGTYTQHVLANRPDPPPPTVEKVERKRPVVIAEESSPPRSETTGSVTRPAIEVPDRTIAPAIPQVAPITSPPASVASRPDPVLAPSIPPLANPPPSKSQTEPVPNERLGTRVVTMWDGRRWREVVVMREPGRGMRSQRSRERIDDDFRHHSRAPVVVNHHGRVRQHKERKRGRGGDPLFRVARGNF